jgi:hypothetical protein
VPTWLSGATFTAVLDVLGSLVLGGYLVVKGTASVLT